MGSRRHLSVRPLAHEGPGFPDRQSAADGLSGALQVVHVFSYTRTDTIARYQRLAGREVPYPMGWIDNGFPAIWPVHNYCEVRCDPNMSHNPDFVAPTDSGGPRSIRSSPVKGEAQSRARTLPHGFQRGEMSWCLDVSGGRGGT